MYSFNYANIHVFAEMKCNILWRQLGLGLMGRVIRQSITQLYMSTRCYVLD